MRIVSSPFPLVVSLLLLLLCASALCHGFHATASRLQSVPIVSPDTSNPTYTYNPAWVEPTAANGNRSCLLIRCQNASSPTNPSPGPSFMALTCADNTTALTQFPPLQWDSVVFRPTTPKEILGTEDPRLAWVPAISAYTLFYTAVSKGSEGRWIARLSLATATDPANESSWVRHGQLFPDVDGFQFTKSGALLVPPADAQYPPYLIFGDCSLYNGLQVASVSSDYLSYSVLEDFLLVQPREGYFDDYLVESGPPPLQMRDGNWFFIYNSAQTLHGVPNNLFYNPGWVVLNGSDPLQILQRSNHPLMMPTYLWEVRGLTPYVVFVEGMRHTPPPTTHDEAEKADSVAETIVGDFIVYYGAADTNVGAARVVVTKVSGGNGAFTVEVLNPRRDPRV